jgi:hypothetical protein
MRWIVRTLIAIWFLFILFLGFNHSFASPQGKPPLALGIAFIAPILLFPAALRFIPTCRSYVLGINPIFLATLHGWRFVGLGFIMAYSEHLLSASFAWPAGIGDITVAILTPWIVLSLAADDQFPRSPLFLAWNLFGIVDFLVAIATGALDQGFLPAFQAPISSALVARLPFVLIPCFFVPWLFITHIILLMQRRREAPITHTAKPLPEAPSPHFHSGKS